MLTRIIIALALTEILYFGLGSTLVEILLGVTCYYAILEYWRITR